MLRKWSPFHTIVAVYFLCWGFSAADRILIAMMFPKVLPSFGLNYAMAGVIMSVMSIGYLVCAVIGGWVSDKVGRKKIALPMVFIFSLVSALTGVAKNFAQLIGVRTIVGGAEGAFNMAATAQIAEESPLEKRGFYIGLYTGAFPLFASLVAPLYAGTVGVAYGWRAACYLTIIPGVLLVPAVWWLVRDKKGKTPANVHKEKNPSWMPVLKSRNVLLSACVSIFIMVWLWSWLSFGTLYMTKVKGYSLSSADMHMASMGLGGFLGAVGMSFLSDRFGRKPVVLSVTIIGIIGTLAVLNLPPSASILTWIILFVTSFITWGGMVIFLSVIPSESVPSGYIARGVSIVTCSSEAAGIIVAPPLLGTVADHYGLQMAMTVAALGLIFSVIATFFLKESSPKLRSAPIAQENGAGGSL